VSGLTEFGYAAGWRVVRALPGPVARALFATGADLAYRRGGGGTARLAANLRRVVDPGMPEPEFQALVRRAVRSYARYWLEVFRLPSKTPEQLVRGFRLERGELLGENVAAGVGSIVALPHGGNWDAAGAWAAASGWPITTVVERLKPEALYERFLAFRRGLGMEIIPNTGGARPAIDVLADSLAKAHIVPLLADRDLSARGVEVTFFGGRTRMPAGPALLALRTGAPLYVVDMWYDEEGPRGYMAGPLELPTDGPMDVRVRQVTQLLADHMAEGIARHPADWHMLQRFWLDDPRPGPDRTTSRGS